MVGALTLLWITAVATAGATADPTVVAAVAAAMATAAAQQESTLSPTLILSIAVPAISILGTAASLLWRHGVNERKTWDKEREIHRADIAKLHEQNEELHKKLLAASELRRKEQDATGERLGSLAETMENILEHIQKGRGDGSH